MTDYVHEQKPRGLTKSITVRSYTEAGVADDGPGTPVLIIEQSLEAARWIYLNPETIDFLRKALDNVDPRLMPSVDDAIAMGLVEEPDDIKNFGIM